MDFIKINKENFHNKIIIQDNARIHHSKIVKKYALNENIIPHILPNSIQLNLCLINVK